MGRWSKRNWQNAENAFGLLVAPPPGHNGIRSLESRDMSSLDASTEVIRTNAARVRADIPARAHATRKESSQAARDSISTHEGWFRGG